MARDTSSKRNSTATPISGPSADAKLAILGVLKRSDCFKGLGVSLLRQIGALCHLRVYEPGEVVFRANEPGDYLYGVIAGSLRIYVTSSTGREMILSTTAPGDIGGEIAVLDGGNRTTTGKALERTILFIVPRESFATLLLEQPIIALHMIKFLCQRVRQTSERIEEVAFLSVQQRLAKQLHVLASAQGETLPVSIKISQSDLAGFLNATRQVVNVILQAWRRQGYIALSRGKIEVIDLEGMFAYVGRLD